MNRRIASPVSTLIGVISWSVNGILSAVSDCHTATNVDSPLFEPIPEARPMYPPYTVWVWKLLEVRTEVRWLSLRLRGTPVWRSALVTSRSIPPQVWLPYDYKLICVLLHPWLWGGDGGIIMTWSLFGMFLMFTISVRPSIFLCSFAHE